MSDIGIQVWWVFIAGLLALAVVLVGFIAALVISQRRVIRVEREHARKLLEAQEAERAWVAREVHDDALQRVFMVRAELEHLLVESAGTVRPEDARKLAALQTELDDLSDMLRKVAHRLHPSMLEKAGLLAGLTSLIDDARRNLGLEVTLHEPARVPPLELNASVAAYRIAQEALRNIARHAGCRTAELSLDVADGWLRLRISDQGCGFDPGKDGSRAGLGLIAMQERAILAGGRFELSSAPGRGTVVEVAFPFVEP